MLNIIVAFPKIEDANNIKKLLMRNGYNVNLVCNLGAYAISRANELDGGIVICGYRLSDMMYDELDAYLPKGFETLLIIGPSKLGECAGSGVMCLTTPLKTSDFLDTLDMMSREYERRRKKLKSMPKQRTEEEKKILADAKELLMERNNMTEDEAHRYIQKTAMDRGQSLIDMAREIMDGLNCKPEG
jgi:response regulator NasT